LFNVPIWNIKGSANQKVYFECRKPP